MVTVSITVTINAYPLYVWELKQSGISETYRLSTQDILTNYKVLMNYLNSPWIKELHLPDFSSSKEGLQHFKEVKQLFFLNYFLMIVTIYPTYRFIRGLISESQMWRLIRPFQYLSLFPFLGFFGMIVGFDQIFVGFHQLLFRNDYWLFNPYTDPIIEVLPASYFLHCFLLAIICIELLFLITLWLSKKSLTKETE